MTDELIGRDEELARVRSFLGALNDGPASLVLEGEAGVGKTTVWLRAIAEAKRLNYRVLRARPVEVETTFSFAALFDLLDSCLGEVLAGLPGPQRRALEVSLLLEEATAFPPDQRAVALSFTSALRLLTVGGPLVLAVDDVQWLDAPSESVLRFAIRRLQDLPVGVVLARRAPESASPPLGVELALPAERLHQLRLGPLSLGALHRLLRERLTLALPRPALVRVHAASGGNPFFALELGRALQREGRSGSLGEPLPVPRTLECHRRPIRTDRSARSGDSALSEQEILPHARSGRAAARPLLRDVGRGELLRGRDLPRWLRDSRGCGRVGKAADVLGVRDGPRLLRRRHELHRARGRGERGRTPPGRIGRTRAPGGPYPDVSVHNHAIDLGLVARV